MAWAPLGASAEPLARFDSIAEGRDPAEPRLSSTAQAISDDGRLIVGHGSLSNRWNGDYIQPLQWRVGGGHSFRLDANGSAQGVSADGRVTVGYYNNDAYLQRHGQSDYDNLSFRAPGFFDVDYAYAVSADGRSVVGTYSPYNEDRTRAFRWNEQNGKRLIPGVVPGLDAWPSDLSADGDVVVGYSQSAVGWEAFRWTPEGGTQGLGWLNPDPGAFNPRYSRAYAVSADGSVVVGGSKDRFTEEAFVWTAEAGMRPLDTPRARSSSALGVSNDGRRIVGHVYDFDFGRHDQAFLWTPWAGMRLLQDVLIQDFGVDASVFGDGQLYEAVDITPDGRFIAGRAVGGSIAGMFRVALPAFGDANGDDAIDAEDAAIWQAHVTGAKPTLLPSDRTSERMLWSTANFDGDADVDHHDAALLAEAWSQTDPIAAAAWLAGLAVTGDFTGDTHVEQADLNLVLNHWGDAREGWANADGFATPIVDQEELNAVLNNWGAGTAPSFTSNPAVVPEPGVVAGLLLVGGLVRRRPR